jgi:hypothetical protein
MNPQPKNFISSNKAEFGVDLKNRILREGLPAPRLIECLPHTLPAFGFDGQLWCEQPVLNSIFFTHYPVLPRPFSNAARDLRTDIISLLKTVAEGHPGLSILHNGSSRSRLVRTLADEAGIPVHLLDPRDLGLNQRKFEDWYRGFALRYNCPFVAVALRCWAAEQSETPFIFDNFFFRLIDLNVSAAENRRCGPALWTTVDTLEQYVCMQFLAHRQKVGVVNLLKASPEIATSYLLHPVVSSCMKSASSLRNNAHLEMKLIQSMLKESAAPTGPEPFTEELVLPAGKMWEAQMRMDLDWNEQNCYTPIHEVAPWLNT